MFHTYNKPQGIHLQTHTHFQLHQAISEQKGPQQTLHLEDTEYKWLHKGDHKKTHYIYIALRILKEQQKMLLKTTPQRKIVTGI